MVSTKKFKNNLKCAEDLADPQSVKKLIKNYKYKVCAKKLRGMVYLNLVNYKLDNPICKDVINGIYL